MRLKHVTNAIVLHVINRDDKKRKKVNLGFALRAGKN